MLVLPTMNRALLGAIGHRYGRYRMGILWNISPTPPVLFHWRYSSVLGFRWLYACWMTNTKFGSEPLVQ